MMWFKIIAAVFGLTTLAIFWIIVNAMTRPIYNKMYNMYTDDEKGRAIANWTIGAMLLISFLLGYMIG